MKPQDTPSGTRTGWILVACVGVLILLYASWVSSSRHEEHQREETLAVQLIAKFHEEFNLTSESPVTPETNPLVSRIQEVRSQTGKFKHLGPCKIAGTAEPPSLSARCLSTFEHGEAEENFSFHDFNGENRVIGYSANLVARTNSQTTPTAK
jgi:hypothetical protein